MLHTLQASMTGHFQNRNLKCKSMHFKLYEYLINRVTVVGGRAQFLTHTHTHTGAPVMCWTPHDHLVALTVQYVQFCCY